MNGGTLSGGVVIALAATLWLAYLVPTWLRRRDYLNAERNAVRLQQTLRILAETAEAPEEVRVEATARDVARQQKLLKKVRAQADAAARAHAASEARAAASAPKAALPAPERRGDSGRGRADRAERDRAFAHAVRRTRLATSGVVVASLVGVGFGVYSLIMAESWGLLAASAALLVCALAVLRRLGQQVAAHRIARGERVRVIRQSPKPYDHALYDHALYAEPAPVAEEQKQRDVSWAPRPLPKPMHLSPGSRAATAMASLDAAVALRRAAARAELEQRAARLAAAQVPTLPTIAEPATVTLPARQEPAKTADAQPAEPVTVQPAAPSRYARMGMLDDVQSEHIDLDVALRRRRAAG
jgi:hypothetical protein